MAKKVKVKLDGWHNLVTGLGSLQYDKTRFANISWNPLGMTEAEMLYAGDDIAAKIVDELPNEAFREGFELICKDPGASKAILSYAKDLLFLNKNQETWKWARLYGGAGLLLLTDDMQNLAKPLNESGIGEVRGFTAFNRYELIPQHVDSDLTSPNFGYPDLYMLCPRGLSSAGDVTATTKVHYSRILRFPGSPLPRQLHIARFYWEDSVLTRAVDHIKNYSMSHQSAANVLSDYSIAVYKVQGLVEALSSGDDSTLLKRMQAIAMSRSVARAVVVDSEAEGFDYSNRGMAGFSDLLQKVGERVVAAADRIPHTRLLGESPDGSNSTGNSTTMQWYDFVANQQEEYIKPIMLRGLKLICLSKKGPTGGKIPDGLDIEFKPLWQMDEKEAATVRKTQSDADVSYIEQGVLDPQEVRDSRFGQGKYSVDTKIQAKAPKVNKGDKK